MKINYNRTYPKELHVFDKETFQTFNVCPGCGNVTTKGHRCLSHPDKWGQSCPVCNHEDLANQLGIRDIKDISV